MVDFDDGRQLYFCKRTKIKTVKLDKRKAAGLVADRLMNFRRELFAISAQKLSFSPN